MAAVGPGGGVISKQPIKTSRRRYFQNGCRVEACGPLRRNHCIVVSIPACHAGDRGSIPRRGDIFFFLAAKLSFRIISQLVDESCLKIVVFLNDILSNH